jgi:SAM-dependent methyltransferase
MYSREEEFDKIKKHGDEHWWYVGMRRTALSLLERYLPRKNNLRILEIGCGTGINLKHLARYGTPEGIEYDPYALQLSQKTGYACRPGDMHKLDLPSDAYDVVAFFEVLNQAKEGAHESIVKSVAASLAPGGILFVREPAHEWLRGSHDVSWSTATRFTKKSIEQIFRNAGLEILYTGYMNSFLLPAVFLKRTISKATGAGAESDYQVHSKATNSLFASILTVERFLLRFMKFPLGVTVVGIGRKKVPSS